MNGLTQVERSLSTVVGGVRVYETAAVERIVEQRVEAALAPVEALLALYESWQGERDHPGSSSPRQREQLRDAIRDARGGAR